MLKYAFYGAGIYLIVCGLVVDLWMGLGGLTGIVLICLSIRLGRVILFMEYISKFVLLIMGVVLHIYGNLREEDELEDTEEAVPVTSVFFYLILTIFSIILVRCINNKILRV